jgi:hypothetical protein
LVDFTLEKRPIWGYSMGMNRNAGRVGVLVLALLFIAMKADAFSWRRFFGLSRSEKAARVHKTQKGAGQEVRTFKLKKVRVAEIEAPLQNYLDGIKSDGDLFANAADNSLVVTDTPENLSRMAVLLRDLDVVYDNPNPMARQMLITQNMMKSIRGMVASNPSFMSRGKLGTAIGTQVQTAASPAPVNVATINPMAPRHDSDEENIGRTPWRIISNTPTLGSFEMIGWMRDNDGMMVVLNNQGERYVYRHGRVHPGTPRAKPLSGIVGTIEHQRLILRDPLQGQRILNLQKKPEL